MLVIDAKRQPAPDRLVVRAAGFLPSELLLGGRDLSVEVVLPLERGATIRGRVETTAGEPIPGARVAAQAPWNTVAWPLGEIETRGPASPGARGLTDLSGAFELSGLTEGQRYNVIASKDGFGQRGLDYERVEASRSDVLLVLSPEARVVFVDDRNLTPQASGDTPRWLPSVMLPDHPRLEAVSTPTWMGKLPGEVRFLVTGSARLGEEIAFTYFLLSGGPGISKGEAIARVGERVVHHVQAGAAAGEIMHALTLRAVRGNGEPYTGSLTVALRRQEARGQQVVRVPFVGGVARSPLDLPAGRYSLSMLGGPDVESAFWTAFAPVEIDLVRDAEHVLALRGTPCTITVRDAESSVVHGFHLQDQQEGSEASGWFHSSMPLGSEVPPPGVVVWLDPGAHMLRAGLPTAGMGSTRVDVPVDGEPLDVEITLDPARDYDPWASAHRARAR